MYQLTPFKVYVNKHKTNKTNIQKPGLYKFIYKMLCDNVFVFFYVFKLENLILFKIKKTFVSTDKRAVLRGNSVSALLSNLSGTGV